MAQLAQANVARLRAPLDDPSMQAFVAALPAVNALAERSPGFVWRLGTDHGHGLLVITEDGSPAFLNLTVWTDYAALHAFVYRTGHGRYSATVGAGSSPPGSRRPSCGGCGTASARRSRTPRGGSRTSATTGRPPRAFSLRTRFTAGRTVG